MRIAFRDPLPAGLTAQGGLRALGASRELAALARATLAGSAGHLVATVTITLEDEAKKWWVLPPPRTRSRPPPPRPRARRRRTRRSRTSGRPPRPHCPLPRRPCCHCDPTALPTHPSAHPQPPLLPPLVWQVPTHRRRPLASPNPAVDVDTPSLKYVTVYLYV